MTEFEQRLFRQVLLRRTHRGGFDPLPLAPELLTMLEEGARRDGAILHVIADERSRAVLAAVSVRRPPASVLFAGGGEHLGIGHR